MFNHQSLRKLIICLFNYGLVVFFINMSACLHIDHLNSNLLVSFPRWVVVVRPRHYDSPTLRARGGPQVASGSLSVWVVLHRTARFQLLEKLQLCYHQIAEVVKLKSHLPWWKSGSATAATELGSVWVIPEAIINLISYKTGSSCS